MTSLRLRRVPSVLLALVLLAVASTLLAAPASAHARFEGSDPAEGDVLTALPAVVVMSYSEDIAPQFVDTAVVPPGSEPVVTEASVAGADVTIDLAAAVGPTDGAGAAGTWQVVARVVSADGHPVEHTMTFELAPADAVAEPTAAEPTGAVSTGAVSTAAEPTGAVPTAAEPTGAVPTAAEPTGAEPATEPSVIDEDPGASLTNGLPSWAVGLGALLLVGAAATAVVVQLRRRPPGASEPR